MLSRCLDPALLTSLAKRKQIGLTNYRNFDFGLHACQLPQVLAYKVRGDYFEGQGLSDKLMRHRIKCSLHILLCSNEGCVPHSCIMKYFPKQCSNI